MNAAEYMDVLLARQAEHVAAHPLAQPWARPLLDWFIRPGDESLFTPPEETPQPKRATTPRTYRTAASLRAERDHLDAQRAPLVAPLLPEIAAARGLALGGRRTRAAAAREDRRLSRYVALSDRIDHLDHRISLADAREARS